MKKHFFWLLMIAFLPNVCIAQSTSYTSLVREKQRKMAELEKCMGATKGLKIAGLSTLGLTAVGVAGNIAEAKKIDEYKEYIEDAPKEKDKIQKQINDTNAEIKKLQGKTITKPADNVVEVISVQPTITEPEQTGVNTSGNTFTWNPVGDDSQDQYKRLCKFTNGEINEAGTCICPDGFTAELSGTCVTKQADEE